MNFLITGAYGFVGTNLCKYLTAKGHRCDALDIPSARRDDVPYSEFFTWEDLPAPQPSTFNVQPSTFNLQPSTYDCIVHLAGKAHDLKKVASEQSYFDINVGLTEKIFEALRVKSCGLRVERRPRFIYFSSSKADAMGNAYGRSKLAAEEFLQKAVREIRGRGAVCPEVVILRPAMIHGPGNKGNLNLLWGIARRGLPWPLAAFENQRSFTSIGNICAAVEALALRSTSSVQPSTFNFQLSTFFIADDEMLSTNRLIELMAEARGRKARLWRLPKGLMRFAARVGDVLHLPLNTERIEKLTENSFVDNAELKHALGWKRMPIAAEDGMRETVRAFGVEG